MAHDKKSVIVYVDWISTFKKLEDAEAGRLIKHFFEYVNDNNPEAPDRLTELLFEPIKAMLKRDLAKYEAIKLKNKENANIRWKNNNATASDRIKNDANYADNDNDNDNDNDIVNNKVKKKKTNSVFVPPSTDEVRQYCRDRGNDVDVDTWINFYKSKGWMIGKNKMVDWKSAIITWEKGKSKKTSSGQPKLAI